MLAADYVIDMGPKAGRLGGEVVFAGTPEEMLKTSTLTSQYLNGQTAIEITCPNLLEIQKKSYKWFLRTIYAKYSGIPMR